MLFSVRLPAGTKTVPYSDLPLLITEGKYGPREALDENVLAFFGADWVRAESELEKAVRRGEVELLDSSFYPLCPSFTRGRLERAVITVEALRCYLERINGALVVGEDEPSAPAVTQAAPVVEAPASETRVTATGPRFTMTKTALIEQHEHEWPTIAGDIAGANRNGLSAAKAGPRGWREADAMEWARNNAKLQSTEKPGDLLASAMHKMSNLPARRHKLEG